ncbi:MAG: hypothetical protein KDE27_23670 [Planctomycetes bacterium]|nr:hypothetical protein [Planctomycetota bacterium]
MKTLVSIFAAAVIAGLGTFLVFDGLDSFGMISNNVVVNVVGFVLFIAASTLVSGALTALFSSAISRADERLVARLEARIRVLEERGAPRPSTVAATAPPPPPPQSVGDVSATRT